MNKNGKHPTIPIRPVNETGDIAIREARCVADVNAALFKHGCVIDSSIEIRGDKIYPFVTIRAEGLPDKGGQN